MANAVKHLSPLQRAGTLPELHHLEYLLARGARHLRVDVVARVDRDNLPVHCIELGSTAPDAPAIGFFGGVHGVERIGSQVVLAFLQGIVERLDWDAGLQETLQHLRLVFMPLINPGGMRAGRRSNPDGIDLMRNAPVEARDCTPLLLGGQRLSTRLPWYRGARDAGMAPEARAVCEAVESRLLSQPFALSLDCHSGFGARDRLWFPYAHTLAPIECLAEIYALRCRFRDAHPYHSIYLIEPQANRYTTHGDLWDHLYLRSRERAHAPLFLPLTLEMGSWLWVKKSPSQLFSLLGFFNPLSPHRHRRILRQHTTLLEFLVQAARSHRHWVPRGEARRDSERAALDHWYADRPKPAH